MSAYTSPGLTKNKIATPPAFTGFPILLCLLFGLGHAIL